ncbi:MAG: flagellar hook-associated protein FlgK [Candidatus Scalindua sp.]|nr:flagellar hook-associated protein FlgK [Candidatus Scalindua sp.]
MSSADISIGLTGLLVAQRALQTIGHNVANVNTPGYSRQQVSISARDPELSPYGPLGQGVAIDEIRRMKDDLIDSQIRSQTSLLGNSEIQSNLLENLQNVFNELSDSSLNNTLNQFFRSLEALSTGTTEISKRQQLLQDSTNLVNKFTTQKTQFNELQQHASQQITTKVEELNSITEEIALLNKRVSTVELSGGNANDIRDKRDSLITRLSKLADIKVLNQENGSTDILLGGSLVVMGSSSEVLTTSATGPGTVRINGIAHISSGELRGLLNIQNTVIPKYAAKLDTLAASIIKEVNNIHSEGLGLNGGFSSLTSANAVSSPTALLSSTTSNLPFTPSVTTYTSGTVTSAGSTVTGSGTSFSSNVKANDWIKLNDGNFYKVVSVDSDSQLTISGSYTDATAISTNITDGSLYISVKDSSDNITGSSISIASDETLTSLSAKISSISNISSSISNGLLTITAASGYTFSFTNDSISDTDTGNVLTSLGLNTFFEGNDASTIGVTQYIQDDVSRIAASSNFTPGDNKNVLRLGDLKDSATTNSTTFSDFLQGTVAEMGIETRQRASEKDAFGTLLLNMENQRQEISGVSIEEEMIDIVRFQKAFQASARYITLVTEVTETLLSM